MAPNRTYTPPEASVAQLNALRTQMGVARNVIVQPSFYGFDNSCPDAALRKMILVDTPQRLYRFA